MTAWYGLCAHSGAPSAVTTTTRNDVYEVTPPPELKAGLLSAVAVSLANFQREFRQIVYAQIVRSARIIQAV